MHQDSVVAEVGRVAGDLPEVEQLERQARVTEAADLLQRVVGAGRGGGAGGEYPYSWCHRGCGCGCGVDVDVRAVAARAGVGTATLYRHFPLRSDLIAAVFRREVDACADEAPRLAAVHAPDRALALRLQRYTEFVATKRGLAAALHSGDPAYAGLRGYFEAQLGPVLRTLLDDAAAAGAIGAGLDPLDLLGAVPNLCTPPPGSDDTSGASRMVALLTDGLRHRRDGAAAERDQD